MSEWKTYKLGEIAEIIMGQSPLGETCSEDNIGTPLLNGPTEFGTHKPIAVQFTTDPKKISEVNDILFCVRGSTTGKMNWSDKRYAIGRGLAAIRHKGGIDFRYFLKGIIDFNLKNILGLATGSTFPNIGGEQLREFIVDVPDLHTQTQIAQILSSLDDKIELNLQMNQTLEAMAQALFKEWFVDFNFPGFDGELVDGLPKGWRIGSINDIANVIDCLHSKKPEPVKEKTGNIYLQLNNILDNGLLDLSKIFWITDEDYKKWISRIEISQGDCVITNVGRVGAVARIPKGVKGALGRNMTGIRLKNNYQFPGFLITLLKSELIRSEIEQKKDVGTILEALNVKNIPKLSFPLPPIEILIKFEFISSVIWEKLEENNSQNLTLTQTRDALLPKLMSGKIKI